MKKSEIKNKDLFRYFTGKSSEQEQQRILKWLENSRENQREFILQKKIFIEMVSKNPEDKIKTDEAFQKFLIQINTLNKENPDGRKPKHRIITILKYAASIALIISLAIGSYILLQNNKSYPLHSDYYVIETPYGSKTSVRMPDGSTIILNAGSKLTYNKNYGIISRDVSLEGEAFFEVEKHRHPMIVSTSHIAVKVIGTTFNIKSYPDDDYIETTLVEGVIKLGSVKDNQIPLITLKPNERIIYHKPKEEILTIHHKADEIPNDTVKKLSKDPSKPFHLSRNVDVSKSISWKDGKYIFDGEKLENLAVILSRRFDVTISFENEDVKNYTYSGTIGDFSIEQVLEALRLTSPIKYQIREKHVILSLDREGANLYKSVIKN